MTLLFSLVLITALIVLLAVIGGVTIGLWGWRGSDVEERVRVRGKLAEERVNLSVLGVLLAIPLFVLAIASFPSLTTPALVLGAILWAGLATWFWEARVVRVTSDMWDEPSLHPQPPIPRPFVIPPPQPAPVPIPQLTDPDLVHKTFRWTFQPRPFQPYNQGVPQAIEIDLSRKRYEECRQEARLPAGQWSTYATADLPETKALAAHFLNLHLQHNWSTFEQASNVLAFTQQCIQYASDESTTGQPEWPRYPLETLMDEQGDCEDDVILAAAVLTRLGFEVALLYYPTHCALGVAGADHLPGEFVEDRRSGRHYFYGEATADGWHIGEVPEEYRGLQPEIERVEILIGL